MALKRVLLAAGLALAAGSAAADCADRIAFLDEVLLEAAEMSISTSSGCQVVAGARESQAVTEGEIIEPTAPYQDQPEEAEAIEVVKMPLADFPDLIARGVLQDAKSIAALLLAAARATPMETPRIALAPSFALFGVPSSSIRRASTAC